MRLGLRGSGGFGGLRIEGTLDTEDLPPDLARRAEELLRPNQLQAAAQPESAQMADAESYDLTVIEEGRAQEFHLRGSGTSDEVMSLLGELMHEVIVRKAKATGKQP